MNEVGRPSKLSDQLIYDMVLKIKTGLPVKYVCDMFGITKMSHDNWMEKGEADFNNEVDSIYAQYFYQIKKAHAEYIEMALNTMMQLPKNWTAIAWWLERTDKSFMPKQQIETNTDDGKVTVVLGGKIKDFKKEKDDNFKR